MVTPEEVIKDTCIFLWPKKFGKGTYIITLNGGACFFEDKFYFLEIIRHSKTKALNEKCLMVGTIEVE